MRRLLILITGLSLIAAACSGEASMLTEPGPAATPSSTAAQAGGPVGSATEPVAGTEPAAALDSGTTGTAATYVIPDTGQEACYDETGSIVCPEDGEAFYGQDGNYTGPDPSYVDNGDGTVADLVTGLMWQQDPGEKVTWDEASAGAGAFALAGYDDWRLPTIDELYSLIDFSGTDPSACQSDDGCGAIPFIDDAVFAFSYGDVDDGERLIDSQWATSTIYDGTTMGGATTMFGVNFADGRIKGYPTDAAGPGGVKEYFVIYVRGGEGYGENEFADNGDGTVTDLATQLMWQQGDGGDGMEWEQALEYCEALDAAGYDDWRLPNAKELQDLVDYERGPQSTGSAAIDPVFDSTPLVDEGGDQNWGFYWTGTTHASMRGGEAAVYVAFGEALGFMTGPQGGDATLMDVHGAGAQRSDPKTGDAADYPTGHGPQGDVIRIDNLVRCVRGGEVEATSGGFVETTSGDASSDGSAPAGGHLAEAAAALGISEEELAAAMGDPSEGPPDLDAVAQILGIDVEELRAVLPPPPNQ